MCWSTCLRARVSTIHQLVKRDALWELRVLKGSHNQNTCHERNKSSGGWEDPLSFLWTHHNRTIKKVGAPCPHRFCLESTWFLLKSSIFNCLPVQGSPALVSSLPSGPMDLVLGKSDIHPIEHFPGHWISVFSRQRYPSNSSAHSTASQPCLHGPC